MPKLVNRLPAYSLHKASGQARGKHNGKCTYLGKFGTDKSKEASARFIAGLPEPEEKPIVAETVPGERLSVGELALAYFNQHVKAYYRKNDQPTSEAAVIRAALKPLTQRFENLQADKFGPLKLETVRADMIALGWSRSTVNRAVNVVRRCFRWGASRELIPGGVVHGLESLDALKAGRSATVSSQFSRRIAPATRQRRLAPPNRFAPRKPNGFMPIWSRIG